VLSTTLDASAFAKYDNVIATAADFTELSVDELLAATLQQ
jgi:hypothetical protein